MFLTAHLGAGSLLTATISIPGTSVQMGTFMQSTTAGSPSKLASASVAEKLGGSNIIYHKETGVSIVSNLKKRLDIWNIYVYIGKQTVFRETVELIFLKLFVYRVIYYHCSYNN